MGFKGEALISRQTFFLSLTLNLKHLVINHIIDFILEGGGWLYRLILLNKICVSF